MKIDFVFDLDGTLADMSHRMHFVNTEPCLWDNFYDACFADAPIISMIEVCSAILRDAYRVEFWTGRTDRVRPQTERWLIDHIPYRFWLEPPGKPVIRMRKHGDFRPDYEIKQEWLLSLSPKDRPGIVFEDRSRVVQMYRANGVQCLQVADGNY